MRTGRFHGSVDAEAPHGFEAFVEAEHGRLLSLALALTGDRRCALADVDAVLLSVLQTWDQTDPADRGVAARRELVSRISDTQSGDPLDPALADRRDADRIWQAVRNLPPQQAHVLALRHVDGASDSVIAAVLGLGVLEVESVASAAMHALDGGLAGSDSAVVTSLRADPPDSDLSQWAP